MFDKVIKPVPRPVSSTSRPLAASRADLRRLDLAVYAAIAATPTPKRDVVFRRLTGMADRSRLWPAAAAVMPTAGGRAGRQAAGDGLASVAVTSATVNLVLKRCEAGAAPTRDTHHVPVARQVAMPESTSFPSGHAASSFAFATGAAYALPALGYPRAVRQHPNEGTH